MAAGLVQYLGTGRRKSSVARVFLKQGKGQFLVNGKPVHTADAKTMDLDGIVGLRINHNLDVHVEGFDVHR